jgi:HAD superfamily hydrolase (TIGR01484 family)
MKVSVVALDFDGTIADGNGQIDRDVIEAILELRRSGIAVLIVTGRRLEHLREGVGDLRIVDAVVTENGALIVFPSNGRTIFVGRKASKALQAEFSKLQLNFTAGECVIEMEASDAAAALQIIRKLELPLTLQFNRSRLMVLPQGISKGIGLREALAAMRLSPHNTLAIGDAENDHELLNTAEVGAAVAWGSQALCDIADDVIKGGGAPDVARYLRQIATKPSLRPHGRRPLLLGRDEKGIPVALNVRGRNVLIAGDPRSGKSWIAGLLAEQLIIQRYSVCVVDPEGDYRGLETLPGVLLFGGDDPPPRPRELMQALRNADFSTVIDLSKLPFDEKRDYVRQLLVMIQRIRRQTGLPHRILIDEAHYFLNDGPQEDLLETSLGGYTIVSYRVSQLPDSVLAATEAVIATRHTDEREIECLRRARSANLTNEQLVSLRADEAILLSGIEEAPRDPVRFQISPRITFHVRHQHKYLDVPVSERSAFVFRRGGVRIGVEARSFRELVEALSRVDHRALDEHLRRHDLSQWISNVFGDRPLAAQIRDVEQRYSLEPVMDVKDELLSLINQRYTCGAEDETNDVLNRSSGGLIVTVPV